MYIVKAAQEEYNHKTKKLCKWKTAAICKKRQQARAYCRNHYHEALGWKIVKDDGTEEIYEQ